MQSPTGPLKSLLVEVPLTTNDTIKLVGTTIRLALMYLQICLCMYNYVHAFTTEFMHSPMYLNISNYVHKCTMNYLQIN
jgi:hypothetical protein